MSDNPYLIYGPATINFSGGRTSGYMLYKILEAHNFVLPPDVYVTFANTGKERNGPGETLDFVQACEDFWNVPIHWLEFEPKSGDSQYNFNEVGYEDAARNGEPYAALIKKRKYLPNPVTRFCTQELKIRPMRDYMLIRGYEHWDCVIGLRADEHRRVSRMRSKTIRERYEILLPMADAGATLKDVMEFWGKQPFDLNLKSYEGNCDACFLKGKSKLLQIIRENPSIADWWIEMEGRTPEYVQLNALTRKRKQLTEEQLRELAECGLTVEDHWRNVDEGSSTFRKDRPTYAQMKEMVTEQRGLFDESDEDLIECFCTD